MNKHQAFYEEVTHKLRLIRGRIGENIHVLRRQRKRPLKKLSRLSQLKQDTIGCLGIGKGEINLMYLVRLSIAL